MTSTTTTGTSTTTAAAGGSTTTTTTTGGLRVRTNSSNTNREGHGIMTSTPTSTRTSSYQQYNGLNASATPSDDISIDGSSTNSGKKNKSATVGGGGANNKNDLAPYEDQCIQIWKYILLFMYISMAITFTVLTYWILYRSHTSSNSTNSGTSTVSSSGVVLGTLLVGISFFFFGIFLFLYHYYVEQRNKIITTAAIRSNDIVASLFPSTVRDRLYAAAATTTNTSSTNMEHPQYQHDESRFMEGQQEQQQIQQQQLNARAATSSHYATSSENQPRTTGRRSSAFFRRRFSSNCDTDNNNSTDFGTSGTGTNPNTSMLYTLPLNVTSTLKRFLSGEVLRDNDHHIVHNTEMQDDGIVYKTKPIADLFPDTTVMFADIAGFTAWSSVREPAQVFTLLETVFHAFDDIAKKRRVYKVETVGDCYVAVCGLPEPRKDHAVAMARFARDCLFRMWTLTKKLEITLGPDTGELAMRIGLHSGPVTAGVLRGERSRFQLFGDTMNTAARIESTGMKGRIHLSQETADLLIAAGKSNWVQDREDRVYAKGKGIMTTFWLEISSQNNKSETGSNTGSSHTGDSDPFHNDMIDNDHHHPNNVMMQQNTNQLTDIAAEKTTRLIDWNYQVLRKLLQHIVAHRNAISNAASVMTSGQQQQQPLNHETCVDGELGIIMMKFRSHTPGSLSDLSTSPTSTVIEEVKEIIELPVFHAGAVSHEVNPDTIVISDEVLMELKNYITTIASWYRDNPFHNFEHASHVTMSVVKLLSRIIAPTHIEHNQTITGGDGQVASKLHDHTYGITSDPLTQFACVFSALIHDVDHSGVPNAQLVKENARVAALYKNQSMAEQNSIDLAWTLLMDTNYTHLRHCIHGNIPSELIRFRQLVVNSVMATDIVDKELKVLRNARWDKAFASEAENDESRDAVNRKATIVIEHLIQASDVAHTMQHWHIYRKWNERFFLECYQAYKMGRAATDPSESWYNGEIGFFDFYIIPLAKKLKQCGVFGVSSDEYLNYATKNRAEWEARGHEVVAEMLEKARPLYGVVTTLTATTTAAPAMSTRALVENMENKG